MRARRWWWSRGRAVWEPPVDTVFIELRETEAFAASARRALALGFQGKLCIHPSQVGPVKRRLLADGGGDDTRAAHRHGVRRSRSRRSASIQVDGYFVDYPIVEKARRTLALADRIAERG